MSFNAYPLEDLEANLVWLSFWINNSPANMNRNTEALTWGRLAKVAEECGEVVAAYIGVTAQNPRKGQTHEPADVKKELLDVVVTALAAYEHVDYHRGRSMHDLRTHLDGLIQRARVELAERSSGTKEDHRRHLDQALEVDTMNEEYPL